MVCVKHRLMRTIGAVAVPSMVVCLSGCNGTPDTHGAPGWFTERGNLGHWASVPGELSFPLEERWQVDLGAGIRSSLVGGGGLVLVGADDMVLYALDPEDGSEVWTYAAGGAISASPTAVDENKGAEKYVWFTGDDGVLYALDTEDGSERWTLAGGVGTFNSATNYATGRVFQVYMNGGVSSKLRAVEGSTGDVVWQSASFNITTASPMHAAGLVVQALHQQGTVFRAHQPATGDVQWEITGESGPDVSPSTSGIEDTDVEIGEPIRFFLSVRSGKVRAVRAGDGSTIWEIDLPASGTVYGFAITRDFEPNVLIAAQRNHIHALNADTGDVLWHHGHDSNPQDPTTRRTALPALYGDAVIHLEGGDRLVARSISDGAELWSADLDAQTMASPTVGGNTVYIGTSSGSLYAFSPPE